MLRRRRDDDPSARTWFDTVDPEEPGSRFTSRIGIAIRTHKGEFLGYDGEAPAGGARGVVPEVLGDLPVEAGLGEYRAVDGSVGRGASGWIAVAEFVMEAAIGKVITDAGWELIKTGGRRLRDLLARLREDETEIFVSRGAAAVIAIDHVVDQGEPGPLDVEAVTEPPTVAGRSPSELSYVGVEPWLVSLVNEKRTLRYIVAVSPEGEVLDFMRFPMSEWEATIYGVLPPRR